MKKILWLLLAISVLAGCASQYKVSDEMKRIMQSMSREDAMKVFHKALDKADGSASVCRLGVNTDEPESVTPTAYGFKLNAWRHGEKLGTEKLGGQTYIRYKKDFYTHEFHLDSISKIRIMDAYCPGRKDDIDMFIEYDTYTMVVSVTKELEPRFLAALKIWAPEISPKVGIGF